MASLSDTTILMGLIFLSIFFLVMFGNYATYVATTSFSCENYRKEYLELLRTGGITSSFGQDKGRLTDVSISGIQKGEIETSETGEASINEQTDAREKAIEEDYQKMGMGLFAKIRAWLGQFDWVKSLRNWTTTVQNKVGSVISSLPFISELNQLYVGIRLLNQPCVGLGMISFVIFTPMILGMMYIFIKILRGGG